MVISSPILYLEVTNGILNAFKGKRINKKSAKTALSDFLLYQIIILEPNLEEVFKLALKNNLTVYSASYFYLAKTQNSPLLTLDEKLKSYAQAYYLVEGVDYEYIYPLDAFYIVGALVLFAIAIVTYPTLRSKSKKR